MDASVRKRVTKSELAARRRQAVRHRGRDAADDGAPSLLPGHRPRPRREVRAGYTKVQTDLVQMRRAGELPYDWLADNTRWQRKPRTFESVQQASRTPPGSIAKPYGPMPMLTSKFGWKKTRWPASSRRSPARTTCR